MRLAWLIVLVLGALMLLVALSDDVYLLVSPPAAPWHVALRKLESVVAFTIVALLGGWALGQRSNRTLLLVGSAAGYSAVIEVLQRALGSTEGWRSSLLDIGCGALGGLLASFLIYARTLYARRWRGRE